MSVDTNIIVSSNDYSGFSNYTPSVPFSVSINSQVLAAGGVINTIRASTTINNSNAVTQVQIQYVGIDSFVRILPGNIIYDVPNALTPNYQIESFSYFSGGFLFVDSYISNQTGGNVTIPAITFQCQAFLYNAPF